MYFIHTIRQYCMKLGVSGNYVTIKKKYKLGNDLTIFGSVIRPDIQSDTRFGHTYQQIRTQFGGDMHNAFLK